MTKYMFLDFGKVIAYPTTGEWFITPYLEEYIKEHGLDKQGILDSVKNYGELLDRQLITMDEEDQMFYEFYKSIFEGLGYQLPNKDVKDIAHDITYSVDKYQTYKDIREELLELKEQYELILLSDNWPCGEYLMNHWLLSQYFKKLYISSYYGIKKDEQGFFQIPMNEYNIPSSDITFIDDNDVPLDTATSLGIKVYKMDRHNKVQDDKYPVIHNLRGL